jgi:hypothetical protein
MKSLRRDGDPLPENAFMKAFFVKPCTGRLLHCNTYSDSYIVMHDFGSFARWVKKSFNSRSFT